MSEKINRHLIAASVFNTGNPWLDDALAGGLNNENFMLVAAKTGTGKTFFGVQLATFAARSFKRVHYFALEAERFEIERRRLYYRVSRLFHRAKPGEKMPRYREWLHQGLDEFFEKLEVTASIDMVAQESTLTTVYANGIYSPDMFERDVVDLLSQPEKPDLVIIDHLHHFFLSGQDEIESLKLCIHQLKRLKDDLGAPVVVLAQLRKGDGVGLKRSLPKLEDIRGTASLTDVATDVLIISKVSESKAQELPEQVNFPMYFHIAKSRTAAEVTPFAGIVGFDFSTGEYDKKYAIGMVKAFEDPELIERKACPRWARRAVFPTLPKILQEQQRQDWAGKYDN